MAASLAQLMAQGGSRAILLDCDLRNPSLSSTLAPDAPLGILDVTSGRAKLDDATWVYLATGLHFLPATNGSRLAFSTEVLASEEMARLFTALRETYEYVIVDLSPLAPFVDVRAAEHLMEFFVESRRRVGPHEHRCRQEEPRRRRRHPWQLDRRGSQQGGCE